MMTSFHRIVMLTVMSVACVYSLTPTSDTQNFLDACHYMCTKTQICPDKCPQSFLGPWSKRGLDKRGRFQDRHLSFDDHGWFLRLLGRLEKK